MAKRLPPPVLFRFPDLYTIAGLHFYWGGVKDHTHITLQYILE